MSVVSEWPRQSPCLIEVRDEESGMHGFLAVESIRDGLAFGGLRISSSVTGSEVQELAQSMEMKLRAHGNPVGGAKGGLRCAPDDPALHTKIAAFARALRGPLTEGVILGKDMGATNQSLDHLYESLGVAQLHRIQELFPESNCPGRLRDLGGYRKHMTGLGVAWAARAAWGGDFSGARILIQGSGVVGVGTAVRLSEMGAVIVGINDVHAGLLAIDGMPVEALVEGLSQGRGLAPDAFSFPCQSIERDALFEQKADILVLAASSYSVDLQAAQEIQTSLVVEGCNMGLLPDARRHLHERKIMVVDDVLASSSSAAMVTLQMATGNAFEATSLWEQIERSISGHVRESVRLAKQLDIPARRVYLERLTE
jgi:glutamate dehydrogenase (NAD(P)+)